ncbi:MAG: hypothetical protein HQK98_05240 [Nitrospirae bacterium]|nr:hypothetical protein [Nitrospirota bacterium]
MSIETVIEIIKVSGPSGVLALVIWRLLINHAQQMKELLDQHAKLTEKTFNALEGTNKAINENTFQMGHIISAIETCRKIDRRGDDR